MGRLYVSRLEGGIRQTLQARSAEFQRYSSFACNGCKYTCCEKPDLSVPVSLVDVLMMAMVGEKPLNEVYRDNVRIQNGPGVLRLELVKPCEFHSNGCSIYSADEGYLVGRPIACGLFPEYSEDQDPINVCPSPNIEIQDERFDVLAKLLLRHELEKVLTSVLLFGSYPICTLDTVTQERAQAYIQYLEGQQERAAVILFKGLGKLESLLGPEQTPDEGQVIKLQNIS